MDSVLFALFAAQGRRGICLWVGQGICLGHVSHPHAFSRFWPQPQKKIVELFICKFFSIKIRKYHIWLGLLILLTFRSETLNPCLRLGLLLGGTHNRNMTQIRNSALNTRGWQVGYPNFCKIYFAIFSWRHLKINYTHVLNQFSWKEPVISFYFTNLEEILHRAHLRGNPIFTAWFLKFRGKYFFSTKVHNISVITLYLNLFCTYNANGINKKIKYIFRMTFFSK